MISKVCTTVNDMHSIPLSNKESFGSLAYFLINFLPNIFNKNTALIYSELDNSKCNAKECLDYIAYHVLGYNTCALALTVRGTHGFSDPSNVVLVPLVEPLFLGQVTEGNTPSNTGLTHQQIMIIVGVLLAVVVLVVITVVRLKFWYPRGSNVSPNGNMYQHDNAAYS